MINMISGKIRSLATKIRRKTENIDAIMKLDEVSGTNGFIIGYISRAKGPVFQRDIEKEFGITRSTASKVISLMEKKGLIERKSVLHDARLKQIILTQKALDLNKNVVKELKAFEQKLFLGFTEDEKETFSSFLSRIEENLYMEDKKND